MDGDTNRWCTLSFVLFDSDVEQSEVLDPPSDEEDDGAAEPVSALKPASRFTPLFHLRYGVCSCFSVP